MKNKTELLIKYRNREIFNFFVWSFLSGMVAVLIINPLIYNELRSLALIFLFAGCISVTNETQKEIDKINKKLDEVR
jgi:hypothetical protein